MPEAKLDQSPAAAVHRQLYQDLLHQSSKTIAGQEVKEIIGCQVVLKPTSPNDMFVMLEGCTDTGYLAAQLAWYIRGTQRLDGIDHYHPSWQRIKPPDIHSNYGYFIWSEMQWNHVLETLRRDPTSRRAVILLNRKEISMSSTQDHVCTTSLQFLIRNNLLHLITTMRSNNAWFGYCTDLPFFMMLQELTCSTLKPAIPALQIGPYIHSVGSMHLYKEDWEKARTALYGPSLDIRCPQLGGDVDRDMILHDLGLVEREMRLHKQFIRPDVDKCPRFNWLVKQIGAKLAELNPVCKKCGRPLVAYEKGFNDKICVSCRDIYEPNM